MPADKWSMTDHVKAIIHWKVRERLERRIEEMVNAEMSKRDFTQKVEPFLQELVEKAVQEVLQHLQFPDVYSADSLPPKPPDRPSR